MRKPETLFLRQEHNLGSKGDMYTFCIMFAMVKIGFVL
jgi:hypothetical protein